MTRYTVRRGDSMRKIAAAHDIALGALIRSNPQVDDPAVIKPGQVLVIPSRPGDGEVEFTEVYRVRSKDTMGKIARMKGVKLADLIAANPQIRDPDKIKVGQLVKVPPGDPKRPGGDVTPPGGGSTPEWYRLARRELADGIVEWGEPGEHNPRILDYHLSVAGGFTENEVPWCSSFVNWCLEQSGVTGTNSALARSWERWGKKLAEPKVGAVTVFWRESKDSNLGHVGFYVSAKAESVLVLGGNQGDRVSIAAYPKAKLLGYRWPR